MRFLLPILLLATLSSCSKSSQTPSLTVSCAMSLKGVVEPLAQAFKKKNPGVQIRFNYGSSGKLRAQIQYGAPADLFLSAGQKEMDLLEKSKLLAPGTRFDFAGNGIVLIAPGKTSKIKNTEHLQEITGRIAMGNPETVPAGRYAKAILTKRGLFSALKGRMVLGETVRQVFDYVARGEVEAGFVFRSDLTLGQGEVHLIEQLPCPIPIAYPAARLASSAHPQQADSFLRFLKTSAAREILLKAGFRPVK